MTNIDFSTAKLEIIQGFCVTHVLQQYRNRPSPQLDYIGTEKIDMYLKASGR